MNSVKIYSRNEVLVWQTIVLIMGILVGIYLGWEFFVHIPAILGG